MTVSPNKMVSEHLVTSRLRNLKDIVKVENSIIPISLSASRTQL